MDVLIIYSIQPRSLLFIRMSPLNFLIHPILPVSTLFFFNKALLIFATKAESPLHLLCVQSLGDLCWLHATPTDVCNLEAEQEYREKVVRGALKLSFRFSAQGVSRC